MADQIPVFNSFIIFYLSKKIYDANTGVRCPYQLIRLTFFGGSVAIICHTSSLMILAEAMREIIDFLALRDIG